MADRGCKRRKQANPRRKNGPSDCWRTSWSNSQSSASLHTVAEICADKTSKHVQLWNIHGLLAGLFLGVAASAFDCKSYKLDSRK